MPNGSGARRRRKSNWRAKRRREGETTPRRIAVEWLNIYALTGESASIKWYLRKGTEK